MRHFTETEPQNIWMNTHTTKRFVRRNLLHCCVGTVRKQYSRKVIQNSTSWDCSSTREWFNERASYGLVSSTQEQYVIVRVLLIRFTIRIIQPTNRHVLDGDKSINFHFTKYRRNIHFNHLHFTFTIFLISFSVAGLLFLSPPNPKCVLWRLAHSEKRNSNE